MSTQVMIVMPCLNEEKNLHITCNSLGFGLGNRPCSLTTILVIVDNGSTDRTNVLAREIQLQSPKNQVFIVTENERGYIPARRAGNKFAASLCEEAVVKIEDTLILQVDADTIYPDTYVETMLAAAEEYGKNFMVEACVDYIPEFRQRNNSYISRLEQIDDRYETLNSGLSDYVVDDKVVAYWLSDYLHWGGYIREFTLSGDEIFAETTRLFLSAQTKGAQKRNVGTIKALHSERKIIENPSMHFATAGFPRERSWELAWLKRNRLMNLEKTDEMLSKDAILTRALHIIALFYILPIHVDRTLPDKIFTTNELSESLLELIPIRDLDQLLHQPGLFLTDVFAAIDKYPDLIREKVDNYLQNLT